MLFKVLDHKGKFIQYQSLCINSGERYADVSVKILNALHKTKIPRISEIISCGLDYSALFNEMHINLYSKNYYETLLYLVELPSSNSFAKELPQSIKAQCFDGYHTISYTITPRYPVEYITLNNRSYDGYFNVI